MLVLVYSASLILVSKNVLVATKKSSILHVLKINEINIKINKNIYIYIYIVCFLYGLPRKQLHH